MPPSQVRSLATLASPTLLALLLSCSTSPATSDGGSDPQDAGAIVPDASPADAGLEGGARPDADAGGACTETPIARLCVRGVTQDGAATEALLAGGAVRFQVFPKGCHSSSCTQVREASCAVQSATAGVVLLTGRFCLASTGDTACTPDCSGGGFAGCEQGGVAPGSYTAKLGALEVPFTVPSTLPPGGNCRASLD